MKQRETGIIRECLYCLSHFGFDVVPMGSRYLMQVRANAAGLVWRSNTGAGWHVDRATGRISARPVRYGCPGAPDISGFTARGRFIGVECKTDTGRLSDSQILFQEWVKRCEGIYIVARSYQDCERGLREYGLERPGGGR